MDARRTGCAHAAVAKNCSSGPEREPKVHDFYRSIGYYNQETLTFRQMARTAAIRLRRSKEQRMSVPTGIRVKDAACSPTTVHAEDDDVRWRAPTGSWQRPARETMTAAMAPRLCPMTASDATVVLVKQFAIRPYVNGLRRPPDRGGRRPARDASPEGAHPRRAEEQTGYRLRSAEGVRGLYEPGSVTEKLPLHRRIRARMRSARVAATPTRARTSRCWSCPSTRRSP